MKLPNAILLAEMQGDGIYRYYVGTVRRLGGCRAPSGPTTDVAHISIRKAADLDPQPPSFSLQHPDSEHPESPNSTMSGAPRFSRTVAAAARPSQWTCFFCKHARPQQPKWMRFPTLRKNISTSTARPQQQQQAQAQAQRLRQQGYSPSMERIRQHYDTKNMTVLYGALLGTL